jgi:hypothetical protein
MTRVSSRRIARISASGRRALKNDTNMPPVARLFLEIVARTGDITEKHMVDLADEMVGHYGSIDAAITALKMGECGFEKIK